MSAADGAPETIRAGIIVPFLIVAAIWGSTWLVIKDQVGAVPASWSVTYRFLLACAGMFALALARRESLRLSGEGMRLAVLLGLTQFVGNFQFVYRAEQHLTSGLVAVFYALLMVPNAVLARLFLGEPVTRRFLAGSLVAMAGIALLLVHEYRVALPGGRVALGILFTCAGLFSASAANVLQANSVGRRQPVVPLIAWAMFWGVLVNAAFSLATAGPPRFDPRWEYLAGIAYLAIFGSVVTFPLYFGLIRAMGAGRAAYNGVAVPVVAMALSTAFEGYRWTGLAVGGAVLAIAGLLMALSARKQRA
ncbi:DMT family transporter [Novosphingobium album (ex Liu et al. 2023)]|uniref:DMT family transporter n=1 Tax=Novosphingobium album (ex Liu et al. 2023) TaxID=3031130 RepID=A0ABT5WV59_9SPHN|nr:DMT family transporter [Novosphingobium album (ex Liu et al. 2023)]MDE8653738.1 DMT family transporter [Novosphingobium album (ex Liu et al. 2023)]